MNQDQKTSYTSEDGIENKQQTSTKSRSKHHPSSTNGDAPDKHEQIFLKMDSLNAKCPPDVTSKEITTDHCPKQRPNIVPENLGPITNQKNEMQGIRMPREHDQEYNIDTKNTLSHGFDVVAEPSMQCADVKIAERLTGALANGINCELKIKENTSERSEDVKIMEMAEKNDCSISLVESNSHRIGTEMKYYEEEQNR